MRIISFRSHTFVSSRIILTVFSLSSIISNTFQCKESLFLSSKECDIVRHRVRGLGGGGGLPDERSAHISQRHVEAPVSIWLHLNCALNFNTWNETNSVRAAGVTLHAGCRKLKDFGLYHVSPPMTSAWFVLSQEHIENHFGAYVLYFCCLHNNVKKYKSPAFKILLK